MEGKNSSTCKDLLYFLIFLLSLPLAGIKDANAGGIDFLASSKSCGSIAAVILGSTNLKIKNLSLKFRICLHHQQRKSGKQQHRIGTQTVYTEGFTRHEVIYLRSW